MLTGTLVLSLTWVVETGESVNYFSVWRQTFVEPYPQTKAASVSQKQASFLLLYKCKFFCKTVGSVVCLKHAM